jgi:hypothetical protein
MGLLLYHMVKVPLNVKLFLHDRRSTIFLSLDSTMIIFSLRFQFEFKSMNDLKAKNPSHHWIDLVTKMNFGFSCQGHLIIYWVMTKEMFFFAKNEKKTPTSIVTHSCIKKLIVINYQIGRNKHYQESFKISSQNSIRNFYKIDSKKTTNLIFCKYLEYVNF